MLIASGKTDCFTHCEKIKHKSRWVLPIMAYTGKLRPNCERGIFSRLQVYERVGISIVEVHERVEKSVSFRSVKRPKRANRRILWLWKSPENFLASFVIYSQFNDSAFTAKSNAKFQTRYLKGVPFVNWRYWVREGYLFSQKKYIERYWTSRRSFTRWNFAAEFLLPRGAQIFSIPDCRHSQKNLLSVYPKNTFHCLSR